MLKTKIKLNKIKQIKKIYKLKISSKILKFKKKQNGILTDEDINYLFMGMINLIKNNALKKAECYYKNEVNYYQQLLNLNLNKVVRLEREIKKLKTKS